LLLVESKAHRTAAFELRTQKAALTVNIAIGHSLAPVGTRRMGAYRSVLEQPAIRCACVACFPPLLQVRPQHDEMPDHFAVPFRFGALRPISSK
jgi:hypothetical protein